MAKRDPNTGKYVSTKAKVKATTKPMPKVKEAIEPKAVKEAAPEPKPDYGKCASCSSSLERMLHDSRAKVPKYMIVCNNKNCNKYRYVMEWQ